METIVRFFQIGIYGENMFSFFSLDQNLLRWTKITTVKILYFRYNIRIGFNGVIRIKKRGSAKILLAVITVVGGSNLLLAAAGNNYLPASSSFFSFSS